MSRRISIWLLACLGITATPAAGQTSANVLLVINQTDLSSTEIGGHYAKLRGLGPTQIVQLKTTSADTISRRDYQRTIEGPISRWLTKHGLQDQILYIVLTKGIPLRILGTTGREGTSASVDSELTLLYRSMLGIASAHTGRVPNPYYAGATPATAAKPFSRAAFDIYLVARLDGFNTADVLALIDRSRSAPAPAGRIVLDQRATLPDKTGDVWLEQTAAALKKEGQGERVVLETTRAAAAAPGPVVGYYSWGSNDAALRQRRIGMKFEPGAIGGMFLSSDARTFKEPPVAWAPVTSELRDPLFGPGSQSLAGDLIRDGISGVAANVAEPFMDGMVRPQVLFPAYLAGRNLAESFYLATPYLSWQTIVIGDPLSAPFGNATTQAEPLDDRVDPETELPRLFSERRVALIAKGNTTPEIAKLLLKAEARTAKDPSANVEDLLLKVLALDPGSSAAKLRLSLFYEERKDWDKAIAIYRQMIDGDANAVAMNNLAYLLAVRKNQLQEAQELAEKAFLLVRSPLIADTLGWIHFLTGDYRKALPFLEFAASGEPDSVDILTHLATVYVELGDKLRARAILDALVALDETLSENPDIKKLRERAKTP